MCWDAAAPDRSPRTGTATRTAAGKSRSANRLSRSGCGRLRRGVGVLAPYGGVFGAGFAELGSGVMGGGGSVGWSAAGSGR